MLLNVMLDWGTNLCSMSLCHCFSFLKETCLDMMNFMQPQGHKYSLLLILVSRVQLRKSSCIAFQEWNGWCLLLIWKPQL